MSKVVILPIYTANFLENLQFIENSSLLTIKSYALDLFQAYSDLGVPHYKWNVEKKQFDTRQTAGPSLPYVRYTEDQILRASINAQGRWSHLSPASRQRKSATLKSFLKFLFRENLTSRDLSSQITLPRIPRKIPHFISVDEVIAVIKATATVDISNSELSLTPSKVQSHQTRTLVLLLYGGGLRVSEACHLTWSNVQIEQGILLVTGKGGRERRVAIPRIVMEELKSLPRLGTYVFGATPLSARKAYSLVKKAGMSAGLIKNLNPHALRHSYATHLLSGGMDIRILQDLLGHQSLNSTEKYLHISLEQLARTMEAHHPFGEDPETC
ncbi:MAG: tyrosine-type recombinase/integrase [Bdellovibrionales bacterium]|nr:tyrosine-type recombinase/integrase [Bdellovibrionales bacterium]